MFGSMESRRTSQVKYLKTYQQEGEKISAYVLRLETLLRRAVEKRAIPRNIADQVRLEQVMAGANLSNVLWCRLRELKDQGPLPTFLQLMKVIPERRKKKKRPTLNTRAGRNQEGRALAAGTIQETTERHPHSIPDLVGIRMMFDKANLITVDSSLKCRTEVKH